MKRFIVILIIVCLAAGVFMNAQKNEAFAQMQGENRTLLVHGSHEIVVPPDIAYVNLGVATKNLNVTDAQKNNAIIVANVKNGIIALGINPFNITTSSYSVSPNYEYIAGSSKQNGHVVNCILRVMLEDFELIGKVIDAGGINGVNTVLGVEFSLKDNSDLYSEALNKATKNAKQKAQIIASAHEIELGLPISIKEIEQFDNKIVALKARTFNEDSTSYSPQNLSVKASVEINYSII